MKKLIHILMLSTTIIVSGQSSDILISKSDTLNLYSNPLELRIDWEQLDQAIFNEIEDIRTEELKDSIIEFNPWGNYKTEWLIENDSLFLTKITSSYDSDYNVSLEKLFSTSKNRIFADWLNSSLIIFSGNCIVCTGTHHKNTSIYPNEELFDFKNGVLKKTEEYKNSVLKESKLLSSDPNTYQNFIYQNIKWNKLPDLTNRHFQVYVSIKPGKNGKLKNIDWENTYLIDGSKLIGDPENIYIKEAVRITKKIPNWNVIIRHNKIMNQGISIVFNEHMREKYAR
ncbi:MAG: hypothetical protein CVU07_01060 [Bacteroidetes bacterium HGW-Bacteroidetes-23]|nr:MAG: hypothetical protein CVU07_01060 [Bacteroidetes bacterium HGW-Bacteroidetes-23]